LQLNLASFEAVNAQVLGISVDHVWSHKAFAEQLGGLSYPLLADFYPHGEVRWSQVIERGWPGVAEVLSVLETLSKA
jgi:peroxiredoxin